MVCILRVRAAGNLKPDGDALNPSPLRIHVEYQIPNAQEEPQLTPERRAFLLDELLPSAVAEVSRRLLARYPARGDLTLPRQCEREIVFRNGTRPGFCTSYAPVRPFCSFPELGVRNNRSLYGPAKVYDCSGLQCVAEELPGGPGVPQADFVLYATSKNVSCGASTLAYSGFCELDPETGRPLAGYVNFCPASISLEPCKFGVQLATGVHEILHALFFSRNLFPLFIDPATGLTRGEDRVVSGNTIISPAVVAAARMHFGCPSLKGAPLEDAGGSGTSESHWEARYFNNELMTGSTSMLELSPWSPITSALAEDSGWYVSNPAADGHLQWGRGAGCGFLELSCAEFAERNPSQPWFCWPVPAGAGPEAPRSCEPEGLAAAHCSRDELIGDPTCFLKKRFEWGGDPGEGPDRCHTRDSRCTKDFNAHPSDAGKLFGLTWGPKARCFEFEGGLRAAAPSRAVWPAGNSPGCFQAECSDEGELFLLLPGREGAPLRCPGGASVDAAAAGLRGGKFLCPENGPYCAALACPGACSGNGWCVNGTCICGLGFSGPACSDRACPAAPCPAWLSCNVASGECEPKDGSAATSFTGGSPTSPAETPLPLLAPTLSFPGASGDPKLEDAASASPSPTTHGFTPTDPTPVPSGSLSWKGATPEQEIPERTTTPLSWPTPTPSGTPSPWLDGPISMASPATLFIDNTGQPTPSSMSTSTTPYKGDTPVSITSLPIAKASGEHSPSTVGENSGYVPGFGETLPTGHVESPEPQPNPAPPDSAMTVLPSKAGAVEPNPLGRSPLGPRPADEQDNAASRPSREGSPPEEPLDKSSAAGTSNDPEPELFSRALQDIFVLFRLRLSRVSIRTLDLNLQQALRQVIAEEVNERRSGSRRLLITDVLLEATLEEGTAVFQFSISPLDGSMDDAEAMRAAVSAAISVPEALTSRLADVGLGSDVRLEEVEQDPVIVVGGATLSPGPTLTPEPSSSHPWYSNYWWRQLREEINRKPWIIGIIVLLAVSLLSAILASCWACHRHHRRRVHRVWSVGSDEIACVHGGSLKHIPMGIEEWELDPHCPLPRPPHPSLGFPPASLSLLPSEGLPWDAKSVVELPIGPLSASPKKMMLSEPAEYFTVTCRPIYERMVITPASEPEAVDALKASLQPGVALLCYDYKTFSAQEILGHMKHILQPPSPELTSIAVMAYPGSNVSVAISADVQLSKEGLEDRRTGVAAFWKALSGFVHCQGYIALLDCGLLQDPDRGAGLLRALQSLTHIRHAASDNAVAGYPLHVLSAKGELEATTILALEEHFDPHQYHHNFMPGATHGNVDSADP